MLKLYNTLSRKIEVFKPIKKSLVTMYSCGPTVYNYVHVGNLRTYLMNDFIKRVLQYNGFKVRHAMNFTDVDDKIIKKIREEKISLKELTTKYENAFLKDINEINIIKPDCILRATESINDMVSLIQKLIKKGYAYKASDGIYFSISKFKNYGKLAQLEKIKTTKERIRKDEYDKSNPQDFALWKFYTPEDGNVFWETALGKGRPGWHIECSAMSIKCLGEQLDIHTGATDLIFPHHSNEIAQSEAATGKKFVNYWIHGGFLTFREGKMSKSLGNVYRLNDLKELGYSPFAFRYFCLLTHYKKPLEFSLDNLDAAQTSFNRIKHKIIALKAESHKGEDNSAEYEKEFIEAINDDLNMPLAVQILHKVLDDFDFDSKKKLNLLEKWDEVLGLGFKDMKETSFIIPKDVKKLVEERETARKNQKWAQADILRERIKEFGFKIIDTDKGAKLEKI